MKRLIVVLAMILMFVAESFGASFFVSPRQQFFNSNGDPCTGCSITFYLSGTSTKMATYSDAGMTIQNANPIVLNSRGESMTGIYFSAASKVILKHQNGTTIWTADPVYPATSPISLVLDQWDAVDIVPTYISPISFSVSGDYTTTFSVGRRIKITDTAGIDYGRISVSSYGGGVTTIIVGLDNPAWAIDTGISAVSLGVVTPVNSSIAFDSIASGSNAGTLTSTGTINITGMTKDGTELITSLNADLLDSMDTETDETADSIVARDAAGNITGNALVSVVATGTAPLTVASTTKVGNLGADTLDTYDTALIGTASTIPVRDVNGNLATGATITKVDSYIMLETDINGVFIANKATAIAFTLFPPGTVPSGTWITFKNIGLGTLTLTGTVDGYTNPTLLTNGSVTIISDGTNWYSHASATPPGTITQFAGFSAPFGWLLCDGSAVSRTSYATLFNTITRSSVVTISSANPGVVTWTGHGLIVGDIVSFETTDTLPSNLSAGTNYYVISAGYGADSFQVSATFNGAAVNTSGGAPAGTHTCRHNPYGVAADTTFNVPDFRRKVAVGKGGSIVNASLGNALGNAYGEEQHTLTSGESGLVAHTHTETYIDNNGDPQTAYIGIGPSGGSSGPGVHSVNFDITRSSQTPQQTGSNSAANAGSAHNNFQPSLIINYIVKY